MYANWARNMMYANWARNKARTAIIRSAKIKDSVRIKMKMPRPMMMEFFNRFSMVEQIENCILEKVK
jgi:hypothetical protein